MIHKQTHQKPLASRENEQVILRAAQLFHRNAKPTRADRRFTGAPQKLSEVPPAKIAELAELRQGGIADVTEYGLRKAAGTVAGMVGIRSAVRVVGPDVLDQVANYDPAMLPPIPQPVSYTSGRGDIELTEDNFPSLKG